MRYINSGRTPLPVTYSRDGKTDSITLHPGVFLECDKLISDKDPALMQYKTPEPKILEMTPPAVLPKEEAEQAPSVDSSSSTTDSSATQAST